MRTDRRRTASILLLIAGLLLLAAGIARGDMEALLRKSMFICMECIGIG